MIGRLQNRWRARRAPDDLDLPGLFSRAALLRAWAQIRANRGAAGVDQMTLSDFERELERHLGELQAELLEGTYRPQPVKRILIPKAGGGWRPLSIWTVRDRIVQRLVYDYLEPIFEPMFLDCSFGFRSGRGVADAVAHVERARETNQRWVLDADIRKCFDNIDPRLLMRLVQRRLYHPVVLSLVEAFLGARVFNAMAGRPAHAGVSQGSVLSPLLCNIYLHEFDQALVQQGIYLVRYADDWLCLCRRKQEAHRARTLAARALKRLRLEVHEDKTRVVHFDQGFTFLGYFFIRGDVYRL